MISRDLKVFACREALSTEPCSGQLFSPWDARGDSPMGLRAGNVPVGGGVLEGVECMVLESRSACQEREFVRHRKAALSLF